MTVKYDTLFTIAKASCVRFSLAEYSKETRSNVLSNFEYLRSLFFASSTGIILCRGTQCRLTSL